MIIQKKDSNSIDITCNLLKKEQIIVIPTDTVYGFSGIVPQTKQKIFDLKGRNNAKGFIQLIANPEDVFDYTNSRIPKKILSLWPAPLTLIVKEKSTQNTLAFRCPADDWLRNLIAKTGSPIYSTSVNYSNSPILSKISDIKKEFEEKVALIVSDEKLEGLASTIVSVVNSKIEILRQGSFVIN